MSLYTHSSLDQFSLNDSTHYFSKLTYKSSCNFKNGDTFTLSFNFNKDYFQIYHNDKAADKISLNGNKTVIPGISIMNKTSIQVIKWEMY